MSKAIKQMEMDALRQRFAGVREMVLLSVSGLNCTADNQLRAALRKKNIRVQMVKNSLARRVFKDLGLGISPESEFWARSTWVAWGTPSAAELSQELDKTVKDNKYKGKVTVKGGVVEGQPVAFDVMLKMPTKAQALGTIVGMIIGPASQIASQIIGPASQIASQINTIAEKKPEEAPAAAAPQAAQ
jgi:large subunit ribosomal protein L10